METDLNNIQKISEEKWDENWEFRSFLKCYDISIEALDSIVHKLYHQVSSKIDCTQCANCCKEVSPILLRTDIRKFSKDLGISVSDFQDKYLKKDDGSEGYLFHETPCPFLKDNLCSNYNYRPKDCISFPHLQKDEFASRLMGVIYNYSMCPIVFNVYELLKDELWHKFKDFDFDFD